MTIALVGGSVLHSFDATLLVVAIGRFQFVATFGASTCARQPVHGAVYVKDVTARQTHQCHTIHQSIQANTATGSRIFMLLLVVRKDADMGQLGDGRVGCAWSLFANERWPTVVAGTPSTSTV